MRRHLLALAALAVCSVPALSRAGIKIDAGDITVASSGLPVTFAYPVSVVIDGVTPSLNVRSVDLKLEFTALPVNFLRTVPVGSGAAFSFPGSDFGATINPGQGTFLRAGSGPAINGFGQIISAGGPNGLTAPANASTTLFNLNFQIPANAVDGTYAVQIVPTDGGVLSLGTPAAELSFDTGDFALAAGYIRVVTVPVPSGAQWNVDASGLFTTNSNWIPSAPSGPASTAVFGLKITQNRTVTVNSAVSIGALAFDNPSAAYTLSGSGSVSVNNGSGAAPISVTSGQHTVAVPLMLGANSTAAIAPNARLTTGRIDAGANALSVTSGGTLATTFLTAGSLSVAPSSRVDLGRGHAIFTATSESTVRSLVSSFLSTGFGLGSTATGDPRDPYATLAVFDNTAVPGVPYFSSFNGVTPAGAILVMYTYKGDTNLNGTLDGDDLAAMLEGYSTGRTGWQWGDVDYNGVVDVLDIQQYFAALANLGTTFPGGGSQAVVPPSGAIPEPGSCIPALALSGVLGRRPRRTVAR